MKRLVIGTKNAKKLAEMRELLAGSPVQVLSIDEVRPGLPSPEETGATFEDNARLKALYFASKSGAVCVADDSGLEVDALDGAPGVFSSRYAGEDGDDAKNNAKLLRELAGVPEAKRGAQFRCVIAVAAPGKIHFTAAGVVRGRILEEPRGAAGFGYDPLFFHPELGCTFAEMTSEQKASVSHRGQALSQLQEVLPSLLSIIRGQRGF